VITFQPSTTNFNYCDVMTDATYLPFRRMLFFQGFYRRFIWNPVRANLYNRSIASSYNKYCSDGQHLD